MSRSMCRDTLGLVLVAVVVIVVVVVAVVVAVVVGVVVVLSVVSLDLPPIAFVDKSFSHLFPIFRGNLDRT